mgnify:CR=1|tara:strand:+ start:1591 stop:1803 length:213 start_codon:yes stop_codon:yes gene_type:complete
MAMIFRLIVTAFLLFFVYQETGLATVFLFLLFISASEIRGYLNAATVNQLDKTLNAAKELNKSLDRLKKF